MAGATVRAPRHLAELIAASDGTGLADRVARRFYSSGLLPSVAPGADVDGLARAAAIGLPRLSAGPAVAGHVRGLHGKRIALWRRGPKGIVDWSLDESVYADVASIVIPEAIASSVTVLDFLFRGALRFGGGRLRNGEAPLGAGRVVVLIEEDGVRRVVLSRTVAAVPSDAELAELPPLSAGQRVAAFFRGVDGSGEPIVVSVEASAAAIEDDGRPGPAEAAPDEPAR